MRKPRLGKSLLGSAAVHRDGTACTAQHGTLRHTRQQPLFGVTQPKHVDRSHCGGGGVSERNERLLECQPGIDSGLPESNVCTHHPVLSNDTTTGRYSRVGEARQQVTTCWEPIPA